MNELVNILIIFTAVQLINVILNTIKAVVTVKGGKLTASIINAITYGFYTIVVVLTASDEMNLWWKIGLTVATNLIGVYFGLWILEKLRKDRLWEITATIKVENIQYLSSVLDFDEELQNNNIAYNCKTTDNNYRVYNIYSYSQKDSNKIKPLLQKYNAKYIVHEETVRL